MRAVRPLFVFAFVLLGLVVSVDAQTATPPVTVGAGLRTSFVHLDPADGTASDAFALNNVRLFVNGAPAPHLTLLFSTEYRSSTNELNVLDAVGRFERSARFNVWFGRMLPPAARSSLYGPFYASHWGIYTDGVQGGYPYVYQGRNTGALYWGQFDRVKVSGGLFDGAAATGTPTAIAAGRVQVDFWDAEPGYYQRATGYGDRNLLAVGVAAQAQGADRTAYSVDGLLERKVTGGGAATLEAEWATFDRLGGTNPRYARSTGGYALGGFLFPKPVGPGRVQAVGKWSEARFREGLGAGSPDYRQRTTELNLNYVLKAFNARLMLFARDTRYTAVQPNAVAAGVGLQLQM